MHSQQFPFPGSDDPSSIFHEGIVGSVYVFFPSFAALLVPSLITFGLWALFAGTRLYKLSTQPGGVTTRTVTAACMAWNGSQDEKRADKRSRSAAFRRGEKRVQGKRPPILPHVLAHLARE